MRQRAESTPLVRQLLRHAATATGQRELLARITAALAGALEAESVGAFEYLPDTQSLVLQAGVGWDPQTVGTRKAAVDPGSAAARILRGEEADLSGIDADESRSELGRLLADGAAGGGVAVAIAGPERPFGLLVAFTTGPHEPSTEEVQLIEAAADTAALALGRLRAERRFTAQRGLIELLTTAKQLEEASSRLLALLGEALGWDVATLWLVDQAAQRMRCVDAWTVAGCEDFAQACLGLEYRRGQGIPGAVWETAAPRWLTDLPDQPAFVRAQAAADAGLNTGIFFPLISGGRVAGLFELFTRGNEQVDDPLLSDLAIFGSQIGQLVEREVMQKELERSDAELRLLLGNLGTGVIAINPDGSLRFANDAAAQAAGLERADDLLAADEEELRSRLQMYDERGNALPRELRPRSRVLRGEQFSPMLMRVVRDASIERWYQVRASPVIGETGELICAIVTFDDVTELKRNEASLRESEEVHRRIGDVLQRGLLPPAMPEIPGIDLGVRFRALGDGAMLGGDFYDAFPVASGRWMIVVGDIAGKGVEAAAFTAFVRYTIRAMAVRDQDPAAALTQLNRGLIRDPAQPRLCTAVCVLIDPAHPAKLTLARAGHPPPLLLRADERRPSRIQPAGEILGAFADARFESASFELAAADLLVLYTDGVSDAGVRTHRGPLEIEGLEARICEARAEDADTLAGAIDAAAAAADGGNQHDDALVVAVRCR